MYDSLNTGCHWCRYGWWTCSQIFYQPRTKLKTQSLELQSVKQPLPLKKEQIQSWLKCSNNGLANLKANGWISKILDKYLASESSTESTSTVDETTIWGLLQNNYKQLLSGLGITLALALISFCYCHCHRDYLWYVLALAPYKSLRVISEDFRWRYPWYSIDDSCSLSSSGEFQTSSNLSQANKVQLTTS